MAATSCTLTQRTERGCEASIVAASPVTGAVRYVDPDGNVLLPARLVGAVAAATFDFTAHGGKALKTANTTSANKAINNAREQAHLEGRGLSSEEAKSIASNQRQKNNRIRKVTSDAKNVIKSGVSQIVPAVVTAIDKYYDEKEKSK